LILHKQNIPILKFDAETKEPEKRYCQEAVITQSTSQKGNLGRVHRHNEKEQQEVQEKRPVGFSVKIL